MFNLKPKPLNQDDFKALIVFDPMIVSNEKRKATFKCDRCEETYITNVKKEKEKKIGWCRDCLHKQRYPDFNKKKEIIEYLHKHGSASKRKSGFYGVRLNRYTKSFVAVITVNGYQVTIGTANDVEEAAYMYDKYVLKSFLDRQLNYPFWNH